MLFKIDFVVYSTSPLFDMVIYPAICGIVVVVVVIDVQAIGVAEEEMIFVLFDPTTEMLEAQDKKEKQ